MQKLLLGLGACLVGLALAGPARAADDDGVEARRRVVYPVYRYDHRPYVYDYRPYVPPPRVEYRLYDYRVYDYRPYDYRVQDYRVYEYRVYDYRGYPSAR